MEGIFVGYYNDSKAYKIWIPGTRSIIKVRDAIFNEYNHIEYITIHATDEDDIPDLWISEILVSITPAGHAPSGEWEESGGLPFKPNDSEEEEKEEE